MNFNLINNCSAAILQLLLSSTFIIIPAQSRVKIMERYPDFKNFK